MKIEDRSIQDIQRAINRLHSADLKNLPYEDVKKLVSAITTGDLQWAGNYKIDELFRGRVFQNATPLQNVSEILNPPPNLVKTLGRVNKVGQSVLYCSESMATAMRECRMNAGDYFCGLKLGRIPNSKLYIYDVTGKASNPKVDQMLQEDGFKRSQRREIMKKRSKILNAISRYLQMPVDEGEEHCFKVTASYAESFLNSPAIHGLLYPSIQLEKFAFNLALKPDVLGTVFFPIQAVWIKINEVTKVFHGNKVTFGHHGDTICTAEVGFNGKLKWGTETPFYDVMLPNMETEFRDTGSIVPQ